MSFYGSGLGDRLIDDGMYPTEIKEFLKEEESLLTQASSSCDLLVEVGCMHGRYLDWALSHDKSYIGVDIVERYIELGQARANELRLSDTQCQFMLGDAETLDTSLNPKLIGIEPQRTLLLFPFNSFGNMQSCVPVIQSLERIRLPFFISTYPTTPDATACRQRYYGACSYDGLTMIEDNYGVTFTAEDGLCSIAYHPDYLLGVFDTACLSVEATQFGKIGIAYSTPGLFTAG